MGHAHRETGEDLVRGLRKLNVSYWPGVENFILRYLKNWLKQSGTASNLTDKWERAEKQKRENVMCIFKKGVGNVEEIGHLSLPLNYWKNSVCLFPAQNSWNWIIVGTWKVMRRFLTYTQKALDESKLPFWQDKDQSI